jgi:hypothetical protein
MAAPRYKVPYIISRYLGFTVHLDELKDLPDNELTLLQTECHTINEECSRSVDRGISTAPMGPGPIVKLLRTSSTFLYAIEQEQARRQRKESILDVLSQLNAVTAERDALKSRLAEQLTK